MTQQLNNPTSQTMTGSLTTKLAQDASVVEAAVGKNVGVIVQNVCTVIVALVIALVTGWELTLVMLCMMPLLVIGNIIETRSYMTFAGKATKSQAQAGQVRCVAWLAFLNRSMFPQAARCIVLCAACNPDCVRSCSRRPHSIFVWHSAQYRVVVRQFDA